MKEYDIFKMYIDEMSAIRACDAAENASLTLRAARGDDAAKSRLIEGNLRYVLELARDFVGNGVPASDLVQEANMALLMAVEEYEPDGRDAAPTEEAEALESTVPKPACVSEDAEAGLSGEPAGALKGAEPEPSERPAGAFEGTGTELSGELAGASESAGSGPFGRLAGVSEGTGTELSGEPAGTFERFLAEYVKTALRDVVKEHKAQNRIGKKVLDRVNLLLDISKRMAEELGREATVSELAQELRMTEEEVKDMMKIALDALEVLGE